MVVLFFAGAVFRHLLERRAGGRNGPFAVIRPTPVPPPGSPVTVANWLSQPPPNPLVRVTDDGTGYRPAAHAARTSAGTASQLALPRDTRATVHATGLGSTAPASAAGRSRARWSRLR